ncbi:MAG TPA: beta-propeller fold lactonase family protein, partial [Planctomycetota bacterium]|nr:beta-propeller fold lactonase family protein [Planctomycetota bacterium]
VVSSNQPTLASHAIDAASGALAPINALAMPGIPRAVAVHPMLRVAYVALEASDVVVACDFDAMGTLGSVIGTFPAGATPVDLATDPLGRFLYAANLDPLGAGSVSVYQVDPVSGLLDPGTPVLAGLNPAGATVELSGRFAYVVSETSNDVHAFSIEPMFGGLTPLGNVPAGMMPAGVTTVGTMK